MIANKDYLLIKAIKQAKCCCNGKDEGDDQSQVTLKKFKELTINDINYMMDYPEDLPVCDVMVGYNENYESFILDTMNNGSLANIDYFFSTLEKAQEAVQYGSYGCGTYGVVNISSSEAIKTREVQGTTVYFTDKSPII